MDFFFLCFISLCIFLDLLKDVFLGFLAIFIRGKMQSLENDPIMPIWYRQYFAISISFPWILNTYYKFLIWKRNYNSTDAKHVINCQFHNNCIISLLDNAPNYIVWVWCVTPKEILYSDFFVSSDSCYKWH